jgi:hypothetical protein
LICLLLRLQAPDTIVFNLTGIPGNLPLSFEFSLDRISWPYAWGLSAGILTLLTTSIISQNEHDNYSSTWSTWPLYLIFCGFGLAAIFSGNINTLLYSWAAIDLAWLLIMLQRGHRETYVWITFAIRAFSILVAIGAASIQVTETPLRFPIINPEANTLLFLSAIIRLITLILERSSFPLSKPESGLLATMNIVVLASAASVLTRCASIGIKENLVPMLLLFAAFGSVTYGIYAIQKIQARDGLRLWMITASFIIAISVLLGEPKASISWGITTILTISLLFSIVNQAKISSIFLIFGLIGLSTLPFTSNWLGVSIFPQPGQIWKNGVSWVLWLISLSLLMAGLLRLIRLPKSFTVPTDRWEKIIYSFSLAVLPITQWVILFFGIPGLSTDLQGFPSFDLIYASLLAIVLSILIFGIYQKYQHNFEHGQLIFEQKTRVINLQNAIYLPLLAIRSMVNFVDRLLEEDGGILWTLLFLLIIFAVLYQFGIGG